MCKEHAQYPSKGQIMSPDTKEYGCDFQSYIIKNTLSFNVTLYMDNSACFFEDIVNTTFLLNNIHVTSVNETENST